MKKKKSYTKQTVPYAILLIVIIGVLVFFNLSQYKVYDYSYDEFIKKLSEGDVSKLEITPKNASGVYVINGQLKDYKSTESFRVNVPLAETVLDKVMKYVDEDEIEVVTNPNPENSGFVTVLINVVPTVVLIGATIWLFSKISGGNKNSMDFGIIRAKLN